MADPFLGEIKMFAGNFAPRSYALANGQLLSINQNQALFSLFGTIYGGDGRTTFALPELRSRLPIHRGQGPGLSNRKLGSKSGVENVTVNLNELATHTHPMQASTDVANSPNPASNVTGRPTSVDLYINEAPSAAMATQAITAVGGGRSHGNVQPFQCINFIIALFGIYPSKQ